MYTFTGLLLAGGFVSGLGNCLGISAAEVGSANSAITKAVRTETK
jgi:hypothetical protein